MCLHALEVFTSLSLHLGFQATENRTAFKVAREVDLLGGTFQYVIGIVLSDASICS